MAPIVGRTTVADGLKTILVCADSYDDLLLKGSIFHGSFGEGRKFANLMQLIIMIEDILDNTGFPRMTTEKRRFNTFRAQSKIVEGGDEKFAFETKTGKLATFRLKVLFRHNASWQGSVAWIEGGNEEPFRSSLELLMLIDSALASS